MDALTAATPRVAPAPRSRRRANLPCLAPPRSRRRCSSIFATHACRPTSRQSPRARRAAPPLPSLICSSRLSARPHPRAPRSTAPARPSPAEQRRGAPRPRSVRAGRPCAPAACAGAGRAPRSLAPPSAPAARGQPPARRRAPPRSPPPAPRSGAVPAKQRQRHPLLSRAPTEENEEEAEEGGDKNREDRISLTCDPNVVGTITLIALTGLLIFMSFLLVATINAIVVSVLMSLAAAGGFLAMFFACLVAVYVGVVSVAVFVISATVISAIVGIMIVTGWLGFFWMIWFTARKSLDLTKHSIGMTNSAIQSYSASRHVNKKPISTSEL